MGETCGMMMQGSSIFCLTKKQICSMIFYRSDSLHCERYEDTKLLMNGMKDQLVYQKDAASIKIEQDI